MAAGAVLLLLLLVSPLASAQSPLPVDPQSSVFKFAVSCSQSYAIVTAPPGAGDALCTVVDLTYDAVGTSGSSPVGPPHVVSLRVAPVGLPNETLGWQAYPTVPFVQLAGTGSANFGVHITVLPLIQTAVFRFDLLANYTAENGQTQNQTVHLVAQVNPYAQGFVEMDQRSLSQKASQNQEVTYTLDVRNDGVYPDYFHVRVVSNDPTFEIAQPAGVYVPPHQTKQLTFTVLTPKGTLYELGHSAAFTATVTSTFSPATYTAVGILRVTGFYLPVSWIPMALLGVVSATIVARRARETAAARRMERGAPERVQPTPRQAVLLAELKRTDPEAYAQRKAQLDALYAQRRGEYKSISKERRARDREESKLAAAEFRAARKRQAAERKALRTQAARERKEARILEAREAKERKAKEKELKRARSRLGKQQAKLAKKEAKAAKKQAKLDAKAAKQAARAAKKAAKKKGE
jgi:hypothetical protein